MTTLLAAGGLMPAYQAIPYQPPPRRPAAAGIGRLPRPVTGRAQVPAAAMTALMVRVTPAGRAWVPQARPAAADLDVSALDLSRWTVLDLLLLPLAAWLAAGWEPGRHRHTPRHRAQPGDRPRPADGPSTRGVGRRRTVPAGWTHTTTTTADTTTGGPR